MLDCFFCEDGAGGDDVVSGEVVSETAAGLENGEVGTQPELESCANVLALLLLLWNVALAEDIFEDKSDSHSNLSDSSSVAIVHDVTPPLAQLGLETSRHISRTLLTYTE